MSVLPFDPMPFPQAANVAVPANADSANPRLESFDVIISPPVFFVYVPLPGFAANIRLSFASVTRIAAFIAYLAVGRR